MAYNPTTWNTGDTITAAALNKIEQGIVGAERGYDGELYIYRGNSSGDNYVTTRISGTFADISAKLENNIPPNILVRVWDLMTGTMASTTMTPIYGYYPNDSTASMLFHVRVPRLLATADVSQNFLMINYVRWNENDEVYVD